MPWEPHEGFLNNPEGWYKGPSLWEVLTQVREPRRNISGPLRMSIYHTFRIPGTGAIIVGRVIAGILRVKDRVSLTPTLIEDPDGNLQVESIEKAHERLDRAIPGDIGT